MKVGRTKPLPFCSALFLLEVTKLLAAKSTLFANFVSFISGFDYNNSTKIMNLEKIWRLKIE